MPLGQKLLNNSFARNYYFLQKSQYWTEERLNEHQNIKMRKLIRHAYTNVPYYHNLFKKSKIFPSDIRTIEDLNKIPITTKEDMAQYHDDMKSLRFCGKAVLTSTGGTTGKTLTYIRDVKSRDFFRAAKARGHEWANFYIGDRHAHLWSNSRLIENYGFKRKSLDFLRRRLFLNMHEVNSEKIKDYTYVIKKNKCNVVRGYANAINLLANSLGSQSLELKSVISTAETLTSSMRKNIQKKLNCEVFDEYGGEGGAFASECHTHQGYHIPIEGSVMEFQKDGEDITSEELGNIVVTDLNNYSMPFIRYNIEDLAIPSQEKCNCGKNLPLVRSIEGRLSDIIVTPSGRILTRPGFFGSSTIKLVKGMIAYQVIQERIDRVIIKTVIDNHFNQRSKAKLLQMAKNILGIDVTIKIIIVDKIEKSKSGKTRTVISKIKHAFN